MCYLPTKESLLSHISNGGASTTAGCVMSGLVEAAAAAHRAPSSAAAAEQQPLLRLGLLGSSMSEDAALFRALSLSTVS